MYNYLCQQAQDAGIKLDNAFANLTYEIWITELGLSKDKIISMGKILLADVIMRSNLLEPLGYLKDGDPPRKAARVLYKEANIEKNITPEGSSVPIADLVKAAHELGALVFMNHPAKNNKLFGIDLKAKSWDPQHLKQCFINLKGQGGDGIEICHKDNIAVGDAFVNELNNIAEELNMKVSGGSDNHIEAEIKDMGKYGVDNMF